MSETEKTNIPEKQTNLLPQEVSPAEIQAAASKLGPMVNQVAGMMVHKETPIYTEAALIEAIKAESEKEKVRSSSVRHLINWLGTLCLLMIIAGLVVVVCCFVFEKLDFLKNLLCGAALFFAGCFVNIPKFMKRLFNEET